MNEYIPEPVEPAVETSPQWVDQEAGELAAVVANCEDPAVRQKAKSRFKAKIVTTSIALAMVAGLSVSQVEAGNHREVVARGMFMGQTEETPNMSPVQRIEIQISNLDKKMTLGLRDMSFFPGDYLHRDEQDEQLAELYQQYKKLTGKNYGGTPNATPQEVREGQLQKDREKLRDLETKIHRAESQGTGDSGHLGDWRYERERLQKRIQYLEQK